MLFGMVLRTARPSTVNGQRINHKEPPHGKGILQDMAEEGGYTYQSAPKGAGRASCDAKVAADYAAKFRIAGTFIIFTTTSIGMHRGTIRLQVVREIANILNSCPRTNSSAEMGGSASQRIDLYSDKAVWHWRNSLNGFCPGGKSSGSLLVRNERG
jgi:hypothetical protein